MESCTLSFSNGTVVHFLWRQFFGGVREEAVSANEGDMCFGASLDACVGSFLAPSGPRDVLVVTQGLFYARYPHLGLGEAFGGTVMPRHLGDALEADARRLIALVRARFRGAHVIVVNTAPMRQDDPGGTNARAVAINARLRRVWADVRWPVVDQETINAAALARDPNTYADHVHFPGKLSSAMWAYAMSLLCGRPASAAGGVRDVGTAGTS